MPLALVMLVVTTVVRVLLLMLFLMRLRTRLLRLLRGTRFGARLLSLLRVWFLTRLGLRLRPGFLVRGLLGLLRVIFLTRLGLRLRARLLARGLLGLLRVIFLTRLRLRPGLLAGHLLHLLLTRLRCARLLLLLRAGLRCALLCGDVTLGLLRRARCHRRIVRRMRHTVFLRLPRGESACLLTILRLALLLRGRLASGGLLGHTVLLSLHCHRCVRLGPCRLVVCLGRLLTRCESACAVLREGVRIPTGCLRRTRYAVVWLRPFIGNLRRRTGRPWPHLLSHTMGRLRRRNRATGKRTCAIRCRLTWPRRTLCDTRLDARRHTRRVRLNHPHVLRS